MKTLRSVLGASLVVVMTAGIAHAQSCKPSKWGADDEIGAANLVTPAGLPRKTSLNSCSSWVRRVSAALCR